MGVNKIHKWLNSQNEKIALKISSTYYRKQEAGYSTLYLFHPRFYILYIFRLVLSILQVSTFNFDAFKIERFKITHPVSKKLILKDVLLTIIGVKYFFKIEYSPNFYKEKISTIQFNVFENPIVSIIIPVYNQIEYTLSCLRSIQYYIPSSIKFEILIIDDYSSDLSSSILSNIEGITYIRNEENVGFLKSCNKGIKLAKGAYIALLNNDTLIQEKWLENLLDALQSNPEIGCVGSKLLYPYGLLQEAGGVIFSDGSGLNYGKFQHPEKHLYNFNRQVDYCSGASLLFRKSDIEKIDYLDERYIPAYYEDTDFCFEITHSLGLKVMYVPHSVAIHFEGVSSGKKASKGNIKSYQEINKKKFFEKWNEQLTEKQLHNSTDLGRFYLPKRSILVIDNQIPEFDKDSGSNRMLHLLKIFKNCGYHVIFVPANGLKPTPYYENITGLGIEIIQNYLGASNRNRELLNILDRTSVAWLSRPRVNEKFKFIFKKHPNMRWVYDSVDLHYVRILREASLKPINGYAYKKLIKKANRYKKIETTLSKKADLTIAITDTEAAVFKALNAKKVHVVPNIHELKGVAENDFLNRAGILFIGNFKHTPNQDAAEWLIKEIMPIVWDSISDIQVYLVGSNVSPNVQALSSNKVTVTGYVEHVDSYFLNSKVFVAPLRYGAGMKGKIGQALEYFIPIISTAIGTEGMALKHQQHVLEANNTEDFAKEIIRLYQDPILWNLLKTNSATAITPFSVEVQQENVCKLLQSINSIK